MTQYLMALSVFTLLAATYFWNLWRLELARRKIAQIEAEKWKDIVAVKLRTVPDFFHWLRSLKEEKLDVQEVGRMINEVNASGDFQIRNIAMRCDCNTRFLQELEELRTPKPF